MRNIFKMKKEQIILFLIILFAAFLRFWQLAQIPPGVHADEADLAYSAYSLWKTGLDPHGGDDLLAPSDNNTGGIHPPVYTNILRLLVPFMGLSIFTERFPSAVFGVCIVLFTFLIGKKIFRSDAISLVSAFLVAVNPWVLHISRQGLHEAISLFMVMLGTTLFLYARGRKFLYIISAIIFGLSFFSYDAPKIFVPPFLIILTLYQKDTIVKEKKYFLIFTAIVVLFYALMLRQTFFGGEIEDYSKVGIFSSVKEQVDSERHLTNAPLWLSSIYHNKLTDVIKKFETSYFTIFNTNWFFVNGGGNLQRGVGNHGQFLLFELPFFFVGIYLLYQRNKKAFLFLLGWMMIGALPGGITFSGNYEYRSIHILPVPIFFSSFGIAWFWNFIHKQRYVLQLLSKAVIIIIMVVYISSYLFTYFFDYPVYASEWWVKQQNESIRYAVSNEGKYENIFVDGAEPWAIYYAFFQKLDPRVYQNAYKEKTKFKDVEVLHIGKYYFGAFNLAERHLPDSVDHFTFFPKNSLIIIGGQYFSATKEHKAFYDPGGVRAIYKAFEIK